MAEEDQEDEKPAEEAGAETAEGEEGEESLNPPKSSSKKMLLIGLAAGALLFGVIGAGLYFSGILAPPAAEQTAGGEGEEAAAEHGEDMAHEEEASEEEGEEGEHGEKKGKPTFFQVGDILVNLQGDGKHPNFLKIKISLELASDKDAEALEALKPRIIDNFQVYLRELRIEDLRGSAGLFRLREELLLRVSEVVKPVRVKDVLFQEMLVQ